MTPAPRPPAAEFSEEEEEVTEEGVEEWLEEWPLLTWNQVKWNYYYFSL